MCTCARVCLHVDACMRVCVLAQADAPLPFLFRQGPMCLANFFMAFRSRVQPVLVVQQFQELEPVLCCHALLSNSHECFPGLWVQSRAGLCGLSKKLNQSHILTGVNWAMIRDALGGVYSACRNCGVVHAIPGHCGKGNLWDKPLKKNARICELRPRGLEPGRTCPCLGGPEEQAVAMALLQILALARSNSPGMSAHMAQLGVISLLAHALTHGAPALRGRAAAALCNLSLEDKFVVRTCICTCPGGYMYCGLCAPILTPEGPVGTAHVHHYLFVKQRISGVCVLVRNVNCGFHKKFMTALCLCYEMSHPVGGCPTFVMLRGVEGVTSSCTLWRMCSVCQGRADGERSCTCVQFTNGLCTAP
jgi:hypothetical protein